MHIVIVGGGIIGMHAAFYLQKPGIKITIIDKNNFSEGCSFGNMGYISPSHFVPLATPGIIQEGLHYMIKSDSPFYIKPRLSLELLKWTYTFWKRSNEKISSKNAVHLSALLNFSRSLMEDIKVILGNSFMMVEKGCLMLYKSEKNEAHELELAENAEKSGLAVNRFSAAEVQELEPTIEMNVRGGVLYKSDCHLHPGKYMQTLKNFLETKGVAFLGNLNVTGFEKKEKTVHAVITDQDKIEADAIVLANGSWLPSLVKKLGQPILMQPGKGYSYTYANLNNNIQYPAILIDGRCAITPFAEQLRIGGTMEISGFREKILYKRMEGIYKSVCGFYPGLKIKQPEPEKIWQGLRPLTPDGLPYIDFLNPYNNVIIAGGHAMLGVSEAAGTGKLISQMLGNETTHIEMEAFRLKRF